MTQQVSIAKCRPQHWFLVIAALSGQALAGEVDVIDATIRCESNECTVSATLQHADTGWDHYANAWRVLTQDGRELGRRELLHPHVEEQPFTRSLSGIQIDPSIRTVIIQGHDSVHGFAGKSFELQIPK